MTKFNGTKGKCKLGKCGSVVSESSEGIFIPGAMGKDAFEYYGGNLICESVSTSNAELIVDAFNTTNECDLIPSELLKQYNDLLETQKLQIFDAVKYTLEQCDTPRKGSLNDFFEEIYNKVKTT
jgi:hypothetical protein